MSTKPSLSEALRAIADTYDGPDPATYVLHEAASALEAASWKPTHGVYRHWRAEDAVLRPDGSMSHIPDALGSGNALRAPAQPAWEHEWSAYDGGRYEACVRCDKTRNVPAPRGGGDEGLESDAEKLWLAWRTRENWGDVARAARSLRAKGGATEAEWNGIREQRDHLRDQLAALSTTNLALVQEKRAISAKLVDAERKLATDGASVVVGREEWELRQFDGNRLDIRTGERDALAAKLALEQQGKKPAREFVVDREKVARAMVPVWAKLHGSTSGAVVGWGDVERDFVPYADAAIAEIERQWKEHEAQ